MNNLAWVLATTSDPAVRNGARAVELASQAERLTASRDPYIIQTLAAAYAEFGQFPAAVAAGQRALDLAKLQGRNDLAGAIQQQLALYKGGTPFHQ
jgi:hypothetical protein